MCEKSFSSLTRCSFISYERLWSWPRFAQLFPVCKLSEGRAFFFCSQRRVICLKSISVRFCDTDLAFTSDSHTWLHIPLQIILCSIDYFKLWNIKSCPDKDLDISNLRCFVSSKVRSILCFLSVVGYHFVMNVLRAECVALAVVKLVCL